MVLTPELIRPSSRRFSMTNAASIATRYIALWNETDPDHRKALMADLWNEAGTYRDPLMQGEGHDQIDTLIAGVQGQFHDRGVTVGTDRDPITLSEDLKQLRELHRTGNGV
jgi:hypothetical protein